MADDLPYDWHAYGRRLRLVRHVLGISEADAAATHGVTVRTYRKWEAGGRPRANEGFVKYALKYDINLDWLLAGDGSRLGLHLRRNRWGKLAILPTSAPELRRVGHHQ